MKTIEEIIKQSYLYSLAEAEDERFDRSADAKHLVDNIKSKIVKMLEEMKDELFVVHESCTNVTHCEWYNRAIDDIIKKIEAA